jgi:hypothetical protein
MGMTVDPIEGAETRFTHREQSRQYAIQMHGWGRLITMHPAYLAVQLGVLPNCDERSKLSS